MHSHQETSLAVVKQKIILTDQVLRLLQLEKSKYAHVSTKYTTLLRKFGETDKELRQLQKEKQERVADPLGDPQTIMTELVEVKAQYAELSQEHNTLLNSSHVNIQMLNQRIADLECQRKKDGDECLKLRAKVKDLTAAVAAATMTPQEFKNESDKYEDKELMSENADFRLEVDRLKQTIQRQLRQIASLTLKSTGTNSNAEHSNSSNTDDNRRQSSSPTKSNNQRNNFDLSPRPNNKNTRHARLKQELEAKTEELDLLKMANDFEIDSLKHKLQTVNNNINTLTNKVSELNETNSKYKTMNHKLSKQIDGLELEKRLLQDELEAGSSKPHNNVGVNPSIKFKCVEITNETVEVKQQTSCWTQTDDSSDCESGNFSLDILHQIATIPMLMSPMSVRSYCNTNESEDPIDAEISNCSTDMNTTVVENTKQANENRHIPKANVVDASMQTDKPLQPPNHALLTLGKAVRYLKKRRVTLNLNKGKVVKKIIAAPKIVVNGLTYNVNNCGCDLEQKSGLPLNTINSHCKCESGYKNAFYVMHNLQKLGTLPHTLNSDLKVEDVQHQMCQKMENLKVLPPRQNESFAEVMKESESEYAETDESIRVEEETEVTKENCDRISNITQNLSVKDSVQNESDLQMSRLAKRVHVLPSYMSTRSRRHILDQVENALDPLSLKAESREDLQNKSEQDTSKSCSKLEKQVKDTRLLSPGMDTRNKSKERPPSESGNCSELEIQMRSSRLLSPGMNTRSGRQPKIQSKENENEQSESLDLKLYNTRGRSQNLSVSHNSPKSQKKQVIQSQESHATKPRGRPRKIHHSFNESDEVLRAPNQNVVADNQKSDKPEIRLTKQTEKADSGQSCSLEQNNLESAKITRSNHPDTIELTLDKHDKKKKLRLSKCTTENENQQTQICRDDPHTLDVCDKISQKSVEESDEENREQFSAKRTLGAGKLKSSRLRWLSSCKRRCKQIKPASVSKLNFDSQKLREIVAARYNSLETVQKHDSLETKQSDPSRSESGILKYDSKKTEKERNLDSNGSKISENQDDGIFEKLGCLLSSETSKQEVLEVIRIEQLHDAPVKRRRGRPRKANSCDIRSEELGISGPSTAKHKQNCNKPDAHLPVFPRGPHTENDSVDINEFKTTTLTDAQIIKGRKSYSNGDKICNNQDREANKGREHGDPIFEQLENITSPKIPKHIDSEELHAAKGRKDRFRSKDHIFNGTDVSSQEFQISKPHTARDKQICRTPEAELLISPKTPQPKTNGNAVLDESEVAKQDWLEKRRNNPNCLNAESKICGEQNKDRGIAIFEELELTETPEEENSRVPKRKRGRPKKASPAATNATVFLNESEIPKGKGRKQHSTCNNMTNGQGIETMTESSNAVLEELGRLVSPETSPQKFTPTSRKFCPSKSFQNSQDIQTKTIRAGKRLASNTDTLEAGELEKKLRLSKSNTEDENQPAQDFKKSPRLIQESTEESDNEMIESPNATKYNEIHKSGSASPLPRKKAAMKNKPKLSQLKLLRSFKRSSQQVKTAGVSNVNFDSQKLKELIAARFKSLDRSNDVKYEIARESRAENNCTSSVDKEVVATLMTKAEQENKHPSLLEKKVSISTKPDQEEKVNKFATVSKEPLGIKTAESQCPNLNKNLFVSTNLKQENGIEHTRSREISKECTPAEPEENMCPSSPEMELALLTTKPKIIPLEKVEVDDSPKSAFPLKLVKTAKENSTQNSKSFISTAHDSKELSVPTFQQEVKAVVKGKSKQQKLKRVNKVSRAKDAVASLLNFPEDKVWLEEVKTLLLEEDAAFTAKIVLSQLRFDILQENKKGNFTPTQQVLVGLLAEMDGKIGGVYAAFQDRTERLLLSKPSLETLHSVTPVYVGVCKLQADVIRVRRMVCDSFCLMGELFVPFFYIILKQWNMAIVDRNTAFDTALMDVLVHIVRNKNCKAAGFNLLNMQCILKQYGYPTDKTFNSDELMSNLIKDLLDRHNSQTAEYAIIILCKNSPRNWVFEKLDNKFKLLLKASLGTGDEATAMQLINIMAVITKQFRIETDSIFIKNIEIFLKTLINDKLSSNIRTNVDKALDTIPKL